MTYIDLDPKAKGGLGEHLFENNAHRWTPVIETVEEHLYSEYGEFLPEEAEIHFRECTDDEILRPLREEYSVYGVVDFIYIARWSLNDEDGQPWPELELFQDESVNSPRYQSIPSSIGTQYLAQVVYPVEVKSYTGGTNLRFSPNQLDKLPELASDVQLVHPLIVSIGLDSLPDEVDTDAELFRDSKWCDN